MRDAGAPLLGGAGGGPARRRRAAVVGRTRPTTRVQPPRDGVARMRHPRPTRGGAGSGRRRAGIWRVVRLSPASAADRIPGSFTRAGSFAVAPTPGGVELVMSPQFALRQVGSRESSAGGFRRAGLARREVGRILLRWARITQAGSGSAPARSQPHRPGRRHGSGIGPRPVGAPLSVVAPWRSCSAVPGFAGARRTVCYASFPPLRPFILRYAPFSRTAEGAEA